jgi:hypothetical protein
MDLLIKNSNLQQEIKSKQIFPYSVDKPIVVKSIPENRNEEESNENEDVEEKMDEYYESQSSKFHYLDNCDLLETQFSLCGKDITQKYHIHLVGYQLVLENSFPYLLYFMILDNGIWRFPSIPFVCATNIQEDEEGEKPPLDIYFENQAIMHILTYMDTENTQDGNLDNVYKGFVKSENENNIYVFLDISQLELKKKNMKTLFVSVDEIINKHHCLGFEIAKDSYTFFYRDPSLYTIYDENNKVKKTPYSMFLCKREKDNFVNLYNEYELDMKKEYGYMSLIDDRVEHPFLGDFYYFSLLPLEYQSSITKIRRFLGITQNPYYIFQPFVNVFKEDPKSNMKLSDVIPTIVEYMNTKEEKGSDEPEEEEESEEKEMQKELYENIKHHDCIYFVESNNNAQTPFWCIKDNNDFVEL